MMDKLEIIDGLPEEEGYYLYRSKDNLEFELDGWLACEIYQSSGGLRIKRSACRDNAHDSRLVESLEGKFIFSERIKTPTTDVDNLSEG